MKAKEDFLDRVYSDKMVLGTVRLGGWIMWVVAKDTQTTLNLKGDYQARVHSGQMVLVVVS